MNIKENNLQNFEWYQNLITDLQRLKYKEIANLIISKWEIGGRIEQEIQKGRSFRSFVPHVERDIGISQSEQWYCWKFRKTYPTLVEELKQQSWRKLSRGLEPFKKETNFEYKLFDVWNFQGCDERYGDPTYPGRIPGQLIKNLLYYFTNENDLVIDPMAGGGTTIDVCKEMKRRYLTYDIEPFREEIKQWDLRKGFPIEAVGCDLIFLDPPYWKKKKGEYVENSISNLDRKDYLGFFEKLAIDCKETLKLRGILAFLMSNYIDYDNSQKSIFTADYYQIFKRVGFQPLYEIQAPLSAQQYQNYDIERAKKEKRLLIISRSLYIFQNG